MNEHDCGLFVLVAKPPGPNAKTRLSPALNEEARVRLASAFVQDKCDTLRGINVPFAVAIAPPVTQEMLQLIGDARFLPQVGRDLGERLDHAFAWGFAQGHPWVAVLDADTPTLPELLLREAARVLSSGARDLVLGPTWDGGYYLLGARSDVDRSPLLRDIPWSTDQVARVTVSRARAASYTMEVLPSWFDVDTPADLALLCDALRHCRHLNEAPAHTTKVLDELSRL